MSSDNKKKKIVLFSLEDRIQADQDSAPIGFWERIEPIGLCYVGGAIKKAGYDVTIVQQTNETDEEIMRKILNHNPDVIGATAVTVTYPRTRDLVRNLKQLKPDVTTIAGGVHVSTDPKNAVNDFDYIVIGEGEETVVDLLNNPMTNGNKPRIPGVAYQQDGSYIFPGRRSRLLDLDKYPALREGLPIEKYVAVMPPTPKGVRNAASLEFSRGCNFACSFCTNKEMWSDDRIGTVTHITRLPSKIVEEIKRLHNEESVDYIFFHDQDFTSNRDALTELCNELIERGTPVRWSAMGRVTNMLRQYDVSATNNLLTLMRKAGCSQIGYGIESGDKGQLKRMQKVVPFELTKTVINLTYNAGIIPTGYLVIGVPGETEESINASVEFAKKLNLLRVRFANAYPFLGTLDRRRADEGNLWINEKYKMPEYTTTTKQVLTLSGDFHLSMPSGEELAHRVYSSQEYQARLEDFSLKNPNYDWNSWKEKLKDRGLKNER